MEIGFTLKSKDTSVHGFLKILFLWCKALRIYLSKKKLTVPVFTITYKVLLFHNISKIGGTDVLVIYLIFTVSLKNTEKREGKDSRLKEQLLKSTF